MPKRAKRRVTKPTKVPPRRVLSDDLVVEVDGKEYHPHAGEWVDFLGKSSVESVIVSLRLQTLLRLTGLTEEESEETSDLYERVTRYLADSIVGWSWTNDDGEALKSPPSPEIVRGLSLDEMWWLMGARFGKKTEEAAKNV